MCKTAPMQIRTQAAEVYAAHREGYLAQLVAPLDDMWANCAGMCNKTGSRSTGEGLAPICSTEVTNVGARRAIERAGFRATQRLLRIEFALQD
jgi:hypothetical protein